MRRNTLVCVPRYHAGVPLEIPNSPSGGNLPQLWDKGRPEELEMMGDSPAGGGMAAGRQHPTLFPTVCAEDQSNSETPWAGLSFRP